ncbi:MAG: DEAD/DEAH box helicase [bacterium]
MQIIKIDKNNNHTFDEVVKKLVNFNYDKIIQGVLSPGQFSVLGGLIKLYPINEKHAVVLDYFGNKLEKIFSLDDSCEKKIDELVEVNVLPNRLKLIDHTNINPGDYVVHDDHGIGIFSTLMIREISSESILYVVIKYYNEDVLYVPIDQISKISTYIGINTRKPKLNKLGSASWKNTYKRTYENIILVAKELLNIYATRKIVNKKPRNFFGDWNDEIIRTFEFNETADQQSAIESVYTDLASANPMDRLICGDVGFGKTEVAIRATAQTLANGYQVAILVPTTLLTEQHFVNLSERFKNLPVKIERISRFSSLINQSEIFKNLESGAIDVIIGTHKLLSNRVKFKNLGLLVIDEEQKFGVKHKEVIKKIEESIDVLTLSATPIPRTLFMSISGIRDISQIATIPMGRKAIETKIIEHSEQLVEEYIARELARDGQVYYLHNEVSTIGGRKNKLQKMFPNVAIGIAHSQMSEQSLMQTMGEFSAGKIKILVCSTIIENGLDLANANTLIVDNSDKFGLSQLYQIRGRIGRSKVQAHSLFTYPKKTLTENAVKRLRALAKNNELGTGFDIALHDLEIRGGGNILGREQHGNMEAIGLVLYSKMLKKAVENLRKSGFVGENLIK